MFYADHVICFLIELKCYSSQLVFLVQNFWMYMYVNYNDNVILNGYYLLRILAFG